MKCPNCSTQMEITEKIDVEIKNTFTIIDVAGKCPNCGNKYLWTQHYKLIDEYGLEVDE